MNYPYMENVDLEQILTQITQSHTIRYQSDLVYDLERLFEHQKDPRKENNFFWISRTNGTELLIEREAFIKETSSNHSLNTWFNEKNTPLLYHVTLTPRDQGRLTGTIHQLNYRQVNDFVQRNAQIPKTITIDTLTDPIPYTEFLEHEDDIVGEYGTPSFRKIGVDDEPELLALIAQNRANTIGQCKEMNHYFFSYELESYCDEKYKDEPDYVKKTDEVSVVEEQEENEEEYDR